MYTIKFKNGSEKEFESLRGADLRNADLIGEDFTGADLTNADLRGVDLRGANLHGANLKWADLTGADLKDTEFTGAYIESANLTGANLTGANLRGVDLSFTDIIGFYVGRHFGFAHFGSQYENGSYVKIGCKGHSLPYWIENYDFIRKKYGYSTCEIAIYGIILRSLLEIKEHKEMEE